MENYFNNKGIFSLIGKWKYHLLIIEAIAIIAAVVISSPLFMKPKFKSKAVIYPSNLYTLSEESETEQMLQILNSQDIREMMFKRLNLAQHYGLDSTMKQFRATLNSYYDDFVKLTKTEFESVEISVMDVDPQFACNMVDSIIRFYNEKVRDMHDKKYEEVMIYTKRDMTEKQKEIDSLHSQLQSIREKYGILDYKIQTREATKSYQTNPDMKKLLENLKEKGGEYRMLDSLLWSAEKEYKAFKIEYEKAFSSYNRDISYCHIVEKPYPADKKSAPVRWLIVVLTFIGVFIMSVVVISVIESSKKKHN